ncbi:MAG TPA: OsmC family peroxiredoxin [Jatrophihabitans sp.]|jgi:osmotically inducible protein OsmC
MPTRRAHTAWQGTLQQGSGRVELSSSKVGTYDVSFPKRAADDADGTTSPEELIAAAHSSCYAMQLSALLVEAGGTPQSLDVTADVSLGPDPAGGFRLTGIKLTVRGKVDGLDAPGFGRAADAAKLSCPVSKALTGVEINLDAALSD